MTCQLLISAYDHRQPSAFWPEFRPFKQRTGEVVYIKDFIGPFKPVWGRMEGPKGGSLILEVDAGKAEIGHYIHKITNRPKLTWGSHGDGLQVVASLPQLPGADLSRDQQTHLRRRFPRTLTSIGPLEAIFTLRTVGQIEHFPKFFKRIFQDLMKYGGPRWVLDARACQKIAWDGGFGRCDRATFERNMVDRIAPHLITEPIREMAA